MELTIRDYAIILLILLNIYTVDQARRNNNLISGLQNLPASVESLNQIQTKMAATMGATASGSGKDGGVSSCANNVISDDSLIAMVRKSVGEELAASVAKPVAFDKDTDGAQLRMLQDRMDAFQKKFSEKLSIKGSLNNDKEKNDKLNALAAKIKDEVLSQCRK